MSERRAPELASLSAGCQVSLLVRGEAGSRELFASVTAPLKCGTLTVQPWGARNALAIRATDIIRVGVVVFMTWARHQQIAARQRERLVARTARAA
jgi:hypothetical protein